ncbi:MAG: nuclear transport factor 2 family protein [Variovorax sp.]
METRPPVPPFDLQSATQKVRMAEDGWNTRDAARVVLAYSEDTRWRNRAEFPVGRAEAKALLERKWARELDYRLIKELWAFGGPRIAVRFAYEWHDDSGHWFRSYGNENWEFDDTGLMTRRHASINDLPINESERKFRRPLGRRPDDHPGLSDLGL